MFAPQAHADKIANPTAVFAGLDKITGRIISFEVAINETVQFGTLQVTPRVCYSRPPTEPPQTDAFAQVDEIDEQNEVKRIFSGWMFADSPGLHGVEHPIYDVWLTDCKGGTTVIHEASQVEASAPTRTSPLTRRPTPTDSRRPPRRRPRPRRSASPSRRRQWSPPPPPLPPTITRRSNSAARRATRAGGDPFSRIARRETGVFRRPMREKVARSAG